MKKNDEFRLTKLSKEELNKRMQNALRAGRKRGDCCACSCYDVSSTASNSSANNKEGYSQTGGTPKNCTYKDNPEFGVMNHC